MQTAIRGEREELSTAHAYLARHGWISGAGQEWNATDEGRRMREDVIERRTDSYTAAAFETLSREERRRLLEAVRHIPDESVSG